MRSLSEAESKALLAGYGIPVVKEVLVNDVTSAIKTAEQIGYPVVVKGHGSTLTHKSERGLVRLGLANAEQVKIAADEVASAAGDELEGFLIQPMLHGRREFVAGLIRDPMFGPVVMFGLGGVFTEALNDVVFRGAPVDELEAGCMLDEIAASSLLGSFRGEKPADRKTLISCLVGISRLAIERDDIAEVDINPLLVDPDGKVWAVDGLVVLRDGKVACKQRPAIPPELLSRIFNPQSIAFVGASKGMGKWGQSLPANLLAHGYPGQVYLVNPRGGTQWGRPVYRSVLDIPDSVDLAVVTIPASKVRGLITEFKEKGITSVLLISSGFSETGEDGKVLEEALLEDARNADIVFLGPNTMGIQNPHAKIICTGVHTTPKPGSTALVSQSGNIGVQLLSFAESQGLGIRAFGGSGNEAMVSIEDFMETFEVDEKTRTVLLYLESIKDGRRFFESARRVGRQKPVVVLKGGRTEAGDRAAASHTGALAANFKLFESLCRQAGVVSVHQPLEMLDASAVFSSLPLPRGRKVAIMTLGGGWGVVTSDLCSEQNLLVEPLDEEMLRVLNGMLPAYWSHTNPVDLVGENDLELPVKALEALAAWESCDAVIHLGVSGRSLFLEKLLSAVSTVEVGSGTGDYQYILDSMDQWEHQFIKHSVRLMERYQKPILGVTLTADPKIKVIYEVDNCCYNGVFFNSPERAVTALGHMCEYRDFLELEERRS